MSGQSVLLFGLVGALGLACGRVGYDRFTRLEAGVGLPADGPAVMDGPGVADGSPVVDGPAVVDAAPPDAAPPIPDAPADAAPPVDLRPGMDSAIVPDADRGQLCSQTCSCGAAPCRFYCLSNCTVQCPNNNCQLDCAPGAVCELKCRNNNGFQCSRPQGCLITCP